MKKIAILFLLALFLISCSSTPRYGCNTKRCETKKPEKPTVSQTLKKNTSRLV